MWLDRSIKTIGNAIKDGSIADVRKKATALEEADRMARVLREQSKLIKRAKSLIIIEQKHWSNYDGEEFYEEIRREKSHRFWDLFAEMSDDAKELLG